MRKHIRLLFAYQTIFNDSRQSSGHSYRRSSRLFYDF